MKLTATWVDGPEPEEDHFDPNRKHVGMLGGDPSNPTWEEYLEQWKPWLQEVLLAVREAHELEDLDVYGEDFNNDVGHFALSDGRTFAPSMRAWGDFRQAMVGKREGYMRYYMRWLAGLPDGPPRRQPKAEA